MAKRQKGRELFGELRDPEAARRYIEKLPNGLHHDGRGLYAHVEDNSRRWKFRYRFEGRDRWMGLGSCYDVTLYEVREEIRKNRKLVLDGIDPQAARQERQLEAKLAAAKNKTFRECALEYLESHSIRWEPGTFRNIMAELKNHVFPHIGDLPMERFDMRNPLSDAVDLIYNMLKPIWKPKKNGGLPNQAGHVRDTVERVIDYAIAMKYGIAGNNAASSKGPLGYRLPPLKSFYRAEHHPSLDYKKIPAFMAELRAHVIVPPNGALKCKICKHPERAEIEAAYRAHELAPPEAGPQMPEIEDWAFSLACLSNPATTVDGNNLKQRARQLGLGGLITVNPKKSSHSRLLADGAQPRDQRTGGGAKSR